MSRDEWFREYERLINSGAPHGSETTERARQKQREQPTDLDRADIERKRERGE